MDVKKQMEELRKDKVAVSTDDFKKALKGVEGLKRGFPNLSGAEAGAYRALKGIGIMEKTVAYDVPCGQTNYRIKVTPEGDIIGSGEYAKLSPLSFDQFLTLGGVTKSEPEPEPIVKAVEEEVQILPLDAPESKPELAADPVPGFTPVEDGPIVEKPKKEVQPAPPEKKLAAPDPDRPFEPFKPLKQMKKGELYEEAERLMLLAYEQHHKLKNVEAPTPKTWKEGVTLCINVIPSCPSNDLTGFYTDICEEIETMTKSVDIRCSEHKSLEFGKWKGALAAAIRNANLDSGVYTINTRGNEIAEIVANTLAERAAVVYRGY